MKKRVKLCTIYVYSERTTLVSNISKKKRAGTFCGNKNMVLHGIKKFLKDAKFYGSALSELLNAINHSSREYVDKDIRSVETTIHAFNPITGLLYEFSIYYDIKRFQNLPYKHSVNTKGENRYEKRLIQQYGGGKLGRYRLALSKVSTKYLAGLLSSVIETEFKAKTLMKIEYASKLCITYPREIVLTPTDNVTIKIEFEQYTRSDCDYSMNIIYNGEEVNFSLKEDEITEESIEKVLRLANKFDEICEIIKKAYNL